MATNQPHEVTTFEPPRPPGAPGSGRYEIVAAIAAGAVGDLWRARIVSGPEEGRVVTLRRIPRSAALDPDAIARIAKAGFAAMELRHPRIAAVLDVVIGEAEIAIVSEHLTGVLLHSLLRPTSGKRPSVPVPVAVRIALDVLEAVDSIRAPWAELFPDPESDDERRMATGIHGGLVLDDLLIANFGETMLLEAGFAGVVFTIPEFSSRPDVFAYRAPEQLEGQAVIDERADVFTVGVLLWELVAGRSLFGPAFMPRPASVGQAPKPKNAADALQASAARQRVLTGPIARLDSLPLLKGRVTKELADAVARCLERDRGLRYQTLREALGAIGALGLAGPHDAVAKLLASVAGESASDDVSEQSDAASNRPTVPPAEENARDTAPPAPDSGARPAVLVAAIPPGLLAERARPATPPDADTPAAQIVVESSSVDAATSTMEVVPVESASPSTVEAVAVDSASPSTVEAVAVESASPSTVEAVVVDSASVLSIEESAPPSTDAPVTPIAPPSPTQLADSLPPESIEAESVSSPTPGVAPEHVDRRAPEGMVRTLLSNTEAANAAKAQVDAFPPPRREAPIVAAATAKATPTPGPDETDAEDIATPRKSRAIVWIIAAVVAVVIAAVIGVTLSGAPKEPAEAPRPAIVHAAPVSEPAAPPREEPGPAMAPTPAPSAKAVVLATPTATAPPTSSPATTVNGAAPSLTDMFKKAAAEAAQAAAASAASAPKKKP